MLKRICKMIGVDSGRHNISKGDGAGRVFHGDPLPPGNDLIFREENAPLTDDVPKSANRSFKHYFPELAESGSKLLPESSATVDCLKKLGHRDNMSENSLPQGESAPAGISVPTIYTFFGQFVDHDITHQEDTRKTVSTLTGPPLSTASIAEIKNLRSPNLDLDSVYGSEPDEKFPPREPGNPKRLRLAEVGGPFSLPIDRGNDDFQDLYRGEPDVSSRKAIIGDPRNDENVVISQLQVAFLRAHNAIVDQGKTFQRARELLTQHYQWIVLDEFLPIIASQAIVDRVLQGNRLFTATRAEELYMPLEFSVAAFRFGHSKIRGSYVFNDNLATRGNGASPLGQLFTFTHFAGGLAAEKQLPRLWVIDWKNFLHADGEKHESRPIDTLLVGKLFELGREGGVSLSQDGLANNLATRNLLRGYRLRIPCGQAVAEAVHQKMPDIIPLDNDRIVAVLPSRQQKILSDAKLLNRMPLWFYILAEAMADNGGKHLGPVGSALVAETIIGILRLSKYSILAPLEAGWIPTLPSSTPGQFRLKDLLILAGVYRESALVVKPS
jgi:hypothetical protein